MLARLLAVSVACSLASCSAPPPVRTPEQTATWSAIVRTRNRAVAAACKANDVYACALLGLRALVRKGSSPEVVDDEAREALDRSCAAGETLGCYWLGRLLTRSSETDDWEHGKALLARACGSGLALCSGTSGSRHGTKSSVGPATYQRVLIEYGEAKCDSGLAFACLHAGEELLSWEYAGERHEPDDFERARRAFHRGCELKLPVACLYEGYAVETGRVAGASAELARSLYENACTLGDRTGCHLAAANLRAATQVAPQGSTMQGSTMSTFPSSSADLDPLVGVPSAPAPSSSTPAGTPTRP